MPAINVFGAQCGRCHRTLKTKATYWVRAHEKTCRLSGALPVTSKPARIPKPKKTKTPRVPRDARDEFIEELAKAGTKALFNAMFKKGK